MVLDKKKTHSGMQTTPIAHFGRVIECRTKVKKIVVRLAQLSSSAIFEAMVHVFLIPFKKTDGAIFRQKTNHGTKGGINCSAPLFIVLTGRQRAHRNAKADSRTPRRT
jgi:hypothetical protein